jgi:hypothetical protein
MANGAPITTGIDLTVATDDVSGSHYQVMKLAAGQEDSAARIGGDATYGLDVDVTRIPSVAVTGGDMNVTATQGGTWNVGALTTITNDVSIDDGGNSITVDNGGTFATQATQAGTWTLSSITSDVSIDDGGNSITVDNAGGFDVHVTGGSMGIVGNVTVIPNASWPIFTTHGSDQAQVNANVQWNDTDVSVVWPLPVTVIADPFQQYGEGQAAPTTITGSALMWNESGTTLKPVSTLAPLPVQGSVSLSSSVQTYTSTHDQFMTNANIQVDDVDVSATNPVFVYPSGGQFDINIVGDAVGIGGGVSYVEGVTAATITGTALLGESPTNVLNPLQLDSSNYLKVAITADNVGIGGGKQYQQGSSASAVTGTVMLFESGTDLFGPVSSTSPLPVSVSAITLNGASFGNTIANSLSETAYDLSSALYSGVTAITNDFRLNRAEFGFSTTVARNITIQTTNDVMLYQALGDTSSTLSINFEELAFNGGDNIVAVVTQTIGACSMDFTLVTDQDYLTTGLVYDVNVTNSLTVSNAIDSTVFDINAAPFSSTTSIGADYILGRAELNFTAPETKTVTFTTADGTTLYELANDTSQNISINFESLPFSNGDEITLGVTQTAGACSMDAIVVARLD